MSLLIIYISYDTGRRTGFLKLSFFYYRGHRLKAVNMILLALAVIVINLNLIYTGRIEFSGDNVILFRTAINYRELFLLFIAIAVVPCVVGFFHMRQIVDIFKLNNIANIYIETNRLASTLGAYIDSHVQSIYRVEQPVMDFFKNDNRLKDYLEAYKTLKEDLLEIKKIHLKFDDRHGAVRLIDQNIISINNQMGLIHNFFGNYETALALYSESYEMYPRALIADGMMLAFIVLGLISASAGLDMNYDKYIEKTRVYLHQTNAIEINRWFEEKLKEIESGKNQG